MQQYQMTGGKDGGGGAGAGAGAVNGGAIGGAIGSALGLGNPSNSGSANNGSAAASEWMSSTHWQQQMQMAQLSRQTANSPHSYARSAAVASRTASGQNPIPLTVTELAVQLVQQNQNQTQAAKNAAAGGNAVVGRPAGGMLNPHQRKEQLEEERQRRINEDINKQFWTAIDLSGQGLTNMTPKLFNYNFLQKLYLNHNKLTSLPASVTKLGQLKVLDLSDNLLTDLPAEIGLMYTLRYLFLFDNKLQELPYALGTLFQLEVLGLDGNPLSDHTREIMAKEGTRGVIIDLRERAPVTIESPPREWLLFEEDKNNSKPRKDERTPQQLQQSRDNKDKSNSKDDKKDGSSSANESDSSSVAGTSASSVTTTTNTSANSAVSNGPPSQSDFSIMSYNTLCDRMATPQLYAYTPSWALGWNYRKERLLEEIVSIGTDIICLQEVDKISYDDLWVPKLSKLGYTALHWPKGRARTMPESEAKKVDGCAMFYKHEKIKLIERHNIDYNLLALRKDDFKKTADIYNRVMNKDNIAMINVFEQVQTGRLMIVANTHLHWDPAFKDVKLVQVALLLEELEKVVDKYTSNSTPEGAKYPKLTDGKNIPLVVCGDYNSTTDSAVYQLFAQGKIEGTHEDLEGRVYGKITDEGTTHKLGLKSAYSEIGELPFTNYTPNFVEVIDYIWYSTNSLSVGGLLGQIDPEYTKHFVAFPNPHHPSDHIPLAAQFNFKKVKDAPPKHTSTPNFGNTSYGSSRKT
ncbi:CCR4-NOT core exoribonuclease subunit CCR4 [Sugiyamaella lignohabitans]|uniref:CCR4-Not complex 3'-5'-exoribonuclease subunit Ccr4 n=1 Tax=Sugiyamaella lignohabitans TaxID=796027 RepID=A0A167E6Z2_9ASCO|nr:CCR4-NOT core exoribonuclease subunit CCR4 [Sugiyamaella lignohabitans]ANB13720.1 CCR4-NOT core exoribonuclease subunit CCR4 [Sugiyamaella lignohabitans]